MQWGEIVWGLNSTEKRVRQSQQPFKTALKKNKNKREEIL